MRNYSPLRYPGGKTIIRKLISNLVLNNPSISSFVEPYAGGAGLGLWLLENGFITHLFLNDKDEFLYKFWYSVLNRTEELIQKIIDTDVNIGEWENQRKLILDEQVLSVSDSLDIGFAALFLNRCNRSGIIRGNVGPIGGKKQESKWKIDVRFNKEDIVKKIKNISSKRDLIHLTNLDALSMIEKIKQENKKLESYLFYLDPPYFLNGKSLYRSYYSQSNHDDLAKFLINQKDINWILSYDDAAYINNLYSSQNIHKISIHHHAHKQKKGNELIITSPHIKWIES